MDGRQMSRQRIGLTVPGETHAPMPASAALARPFSAAVHGPGLRGLANRGAERMLSARLEYTGMRQAASTLSLRSEGGGAIAWFGYDLWRMPTGLSEGIALGREEDSLFGWALDVIDATGANLFKLTRVLPAEADREAGPAKVHESRRWSVIRTIKKVREVLPLAPTYDDMLAGLGRHTRRNIRAARKIAAAERFSFDVSTGGSAPDPPVLTALARKARELAVPAKMMTRFETYADLTGRPFRSALRAADGRVVSYACGFLGDPHSAYLLYQLNDPDWNAIGPSLLHRAYLMEWLIQSGCRELVIVHGCNGILRHACLSQALEQFWFMRQSAAAYVSAGAISLVKPDASIGRLARLALASKLGRL